MKVAALLLGPALLAGCSTHPITGRDQILALPAVQAVHADVGFALAAGAQRIAIAAAPSCAQECGSVEDTAKFAQRVAAIGARLEAAARDMSPELFGRIERFQIELNDDLGIGTGSSAGGRIALGSGLAELEPTDTVIAFLLAREMAHVIARHAEENSGATIVFSVLGLLLPGISVLARYAATTLGSSVLKESWATQQQREADEIAIALLARTGLSAPSVALSLESGVKRAHVPDDGWGARYVESTRRVVLIAALAPGDGVYAD